MTEVNIQNQTISYETRSQLHFLSDAVIYGLAPWRPGIINVWMDYDIVFNRYRIGIEAVFHGYRCQFIFRVDRDDILDYDEWVWKAYPTIIQGFRSRESDPIPSNIKLGEN